MKNDRFNKVSVILLMGLFFSCGNDISDINAFQFDANSPIEISTGVDIQLSDAGMKKYLLSTPRIEKFLIDNEEVYKFPIGFQLRTFDSLGIEVTKISAKKGTMKQKLGEIVLTDSVRIRNVNQERLETDLLFVFVEKDSLFTDQPVTVSSLAGTLTGKFGLTSNLNFTEYQLNKVYGEIETKEIYNEQESE